MGERNETPDPYLLKRDHRSSNRLNLLHWILREASGYLLHPKIDKPAGNACIADVATGTSMWLLETAASLPDTITLHGFDISPNQFPPKPWRPANVDLIVHDMFQPFPEEHRGKYDIVHAQLLICLINDPDAERVLANLVSLLKPDGQLQWFEPNQSTIKVNNPNPSKPTPYHHKLAGMFRKPFPTSTFNWLDRLPSLFESHGLSLEARDQHPIDGKLRLPFAQNTLAGMEDVLPGLEIDGTKQGGEMREVIEGLKGELAEGVSLDFGYQCFVGRKVV